ncbi:MAG: hypothetical protein J0M04_18930 [Verrucomicrobia bacterium]|nr:hypothetical protein [Verrucomicrobiota bacterium]
MATLVSWGIDPIGVVTLFFAIIAIGMGMWALYKRRKETSLVVCCFLAGIACVGVAMTALQVLKVSINRFDRIPVDPVDLINNYTFSAYPVAWVLFGCGAGFLMTGLSLVFSKNLSDNNPKSEPQ